jgi:hypothetical protein
MRVFLILLGILTSLSALAADLHFASSTVVAGVGGAFPAGGYRTSEFHNGPLLAGEYEFGVHRFVAATIGVENFLLPFDNTSKFGTSTTRERVTLMPFGLRGIVPVASGRVELFAGTGGAALWSSEYNLGHPFQGNNLLWHLNGGARIALDRAKHVRMGPTVRYYRDLGRPTQQWLSITADFSYRFGQ